MPKKKKTEVVESKPRFSEEEMEARSTAFSEIVELQKGVHVLGIRMTSRHTEYKEAKAAYDSGVENLMEQIAVYGREEPLFEQANPQPSPEDAGSTLEFPKKASNRHSNERSLV